MRRTGGASAQRACDATFQAGCNESAQNSRVRDGVQQSLKLIRDLVEAGASSHRAMTPSVPSAQAAIPRPALPGCRDRAAPCVRWTSPRRIEQDALRIMSDDKETR
jgi:hypothetical protein